MAMNSFSLQPDLSVYTNPKIKREQFKKEFPGISNGSSTYTRAADRALALMEAEMWAVHPLPEMYKDYIENDESPAYALCHACFAATYVVPIGYVAPFDPWRVKGLLKIARLLSQTAPMAASGELASTCSFGLLVDALAVMDQVTMCEAVLRLVIHWGPMAQWDDWVIVESAREMLEDIESLRGREQESNLLKAWASDPSHPQGKLFFEKVVYEPIKRLAEIAVVVMVSSLRTGGSALIKK